MWVLHLGIPLKEENQIYESRVNFYSAGKKNACRIFSPHPFICFLGDQGSPRELHQADQYPAPHPSSFPKARVGLISLYF